MRVFKVKYLFFPTMLLYLLLVSLFTISLGAEQPCPTGMFSCDDGECIPQYLVCNYEKDCKGGEDELQSCTPPECKPFEWTCGQYVWNQTYCVPLHYLCDGTVDCPGELTEEMGCTYRDCKKDDFYCEEGNDKTCIHKSKKCDGTIDCRSGLDEAGCKKLGCRLDQYRCLDGKKCLQHHQRCDGIINCDDASDEKYCYHKPCDKNTHFQCGNGRCIPESFRCDSYQDCSDGTDELNCEDLFRLNKVVCGDKRSNNIAQVKACYGKKGCDSFEAKVDPCSDEMCDSLKCESLCVPSLFGGACSCPPPFVLNSNNQTCEDRDECAEWGYCNQFCLNAYGGYNCSCSEGYSLTNDNICLAPLDSIRQLVIVDRLGISFLSISTGEVKLVVNSSGIVGIDYHYEKNLLVWSNINTRKIYIQNFNEQSDQSTYKEFKMPNNLNPSFLAVDWISNKFYVLDKIGQKIDIFEIDGVMHTIVLSLNLTNPSDIALDPVHGYMFVADTRIIRANMDGTDVKIIVPESGCSITLDTITKRVYWSDSSLGSIETVDYNGQNRYSVIKGKISPISLSFFEDKLYWTDCLKQEIMSISIMKDLRYMESVYHAQQLQDIKGIKVFHNLKQTRVTNPYQGDCDQMCLLTPADNDSLGYRCACNVGWKLGDENIKSCVPMENFLLYSTQRLIKGRVLNTTMPGLCDSIVPVTSSRASIVALDYDARENQIYYSDVIRDSIYSIHTSSERKELILGFEGKSVQGLAFDWISKYIYFTDSMKGTLNVLYSNSSKNITYKRTLLKNLNKPRALAIHPNKGLIFFSEWDRPANISRINCDGSGLEVFNITLGWPNGLTIDYETDKLYWCDALLLEVGIASFDGSIVKRILLSDKVRHPFSIANQGNFIYVTDWLLNAVVKIHKSVHERHEIVIQENDKVFGIKVFDLNLQKIDVDLPCLLDNGKCEKFCFSVPSNDTGTLVARCGCADGEKVADDGKGCIIER